MKKRIYSALALLFILLSTGCSLPRKASKTVFTAFDTETTGLKASNEHIVEIAAIKFTLDGIIEQKSWLVNPGVSIPPYVIRIHGITDEMIADAPSFKKVYKEFEEFIGDTVLIAHNASFDARFLKEETARCGLQAPNNQILDSLALFKAWFPDKKNYNLGKLTESLSIETGRLHRSLADSECIRRIIEEAVKMDAKKRTEMESIGKTNHSALIRLQSL